MHIKKFNSVFLINFKIVNYFYAYNKNVAAHMYDLNVLKNLNPYGQKIRVDQ